MIRKKSTHAAEIAFADEVMASDEFAALPERVRSTVRNHRQGMRGERETAYMLDHQFGPDNDRNLLIHDLRLPDGQGGFAQFDHILLSRASRTASIFESKNYSGRISKNEHGEWMVWYRSQRQPQNIPNPVEQAKRQRKVLQAWLKRKGHDRAFAEVGVFVSVPPTAMIDRSKIGSDEPIYKCDNLYKAWVPFGGSSPLGRMFSTGVTAAQMVEIADQLIADHVQEGDIYTRLGIVPDSTDAADTSHTGDPSGPINMPIVQAASVPELPPYVEAEPVTVHPAQSPSTSVAVECTVLEVSPPAKAVPVKAGAPIEVCAGIVERTLPDGRIAFRAARDDEIGREVLSALCKGKAIWNPRFSNWICVPDVADVIRAALPDAIRVGHVA